MSAKAYHADGYVEIRDGLEIIGRAEGQTSAGDWANGLRFAASADLLAACEAMLLDQTPRADAVRVCRAAIAKAKGAA